MGAPIGYSQGVEHSYQLHTGTERENVKIMILWGNYPRTNTEPIQSSVKYERLMSLKRFMRHLCPEGRE